MMYTNLSKKMALLCLAVSGLVLSGVAMAQSSTQGAIAGTVEDVTNAVVANASIVIHNDGTNAEQHLTADSSGYFKAPLLEPGTYTVTISASSFEAYRATAVPVQVGQLTTLEPHLQAGASSVTVEVTGEAPILNFESPDFTSNLNKAALENIPVNNRRWSSLAMTTPGVVDNGSGYGLVSVRGISGIMNNVMIDGADDNQAYYSEERGRTREAYSTAGGAVREFAVNTGVYSAEYGRAAGAVINSVTSSGANQLHGEAYFYDRESKWNAYNDYAKLTPVTASGTSFVVGTPLPVKPEDERKIYGFTVGGALIKDKLFWQYTFDQHHRAFPGIAVPNSPSTFYSLPDAALPANDSVAANGFVSVTATGAAASNALDSQAAVLALRMGQPATAAGYAVGANAYIAGIASLNSDLGNVARVGDQEINTPKLDWQVNQKEHVSVLYHRLRWDSPGGVQTTGTDDYGVDTWGNDFVKLDYGVAKLTSLLSTNISNELLYQYGRELNDESQQPYSAYTQNNLVGPNGNVPEVALDTSAFATIGSPYYSYRKALPDERKWQVEDVLHYTKNNHDLTFGGDLLHNSDLLNNLYESNGVYTYGYIGNYLADLFDKGKAADSCGAQTGQAPTSATGTQATGWTGNAPCYTTFVQGFGASPEFGVATLDYSAFGQDNWKVTPTLTLQLGVRYDDELLPAPSATLTSTTTGYTPFPGANNHPSDKNNISIRAGFSKDVFGNGATVLRGGYGMYYGRITNGILLNVELNTGSPLGQYTSTFQPVAGSPILPTIAGAGSAPVPAAYYLSPTLQNPMVHEFDLLVQQGVGKGTVFSVSYLGALGRDLTNFLDENLDPTTAVSAPVTVVAGTNGSLGPLAPYVGPGNIIANQKIYTHYGNVAKFGPAATNFQNITEIVSNVNSNYNAMVMEIQNRSIRHLQFDFNYTWAHSLDFAQNTSTTTAAQDWYDPYGNPRQNYGNSAYNVGNRFVGYALYSLPELNGHAWYTYLSNGWKVDTSFQMQNGLPYSANVTGTSGGTGDPNKGISTGWNGAGGIPGSSGTAGGVAIIPQLGINTLQLPRKIVDDLRVEKDFRFRERYTWEFFAQVFNLANHQNIDGLGETAYKLSGSATSNTATFQNTTYQVPTSSNNSGFLYTPREIEIATKFTF